MRRNGWFEYLQPSVKAEEESELSVSQTLSELGVSRATFYEWYARYRQGGYDALRVRKPQARRFWNRIPDAERERVVKVALERPEDSPRQLAWYITDKVGYFLSESSVYRILRSFDLLTSPAFTVIRAAEKFAHPTERVHQMWQTDFTYFKIVGWGWYYLATVLDDYSRYVIAWRLYVSMEAEDVKDLLERAIEKTGVEHAAVRYRPRLLSDNGSCYISHKLAEYLDEKDMQHSRGKPYHPMTQGKFERYHESLGNVTPAAMYFGRHREIFTRRDQIKRRTLRQRKTHNLRAAQRESHQQTLKPSIPQTRKASGTL